MLVNKLFVWQEVVISICVLLPPAEGQLAVNIATTATLFASPSLEYGKHNYEKDNAIDGDPSTSPDTCDCCYSSANNARPFFTVYLNVPTYVDLIKVHGRTDKTDFRANLQYITVYADGVAPTVTFSNNHENAEIKPPSLPITNITIVREKPGTVKSEWFLMICEIQISVAKCDHGRFGVNCSSECHCLNDTDCIKDTGFCPDRSPRCGAGWEGESCNIACISGTFSNDCMYTSHCVNHSKSPPDTGICEQGACDPGWQMQNCSVACDFGTFGMTCLRNCNCASDDCNKVNGSCPKSSPRCAAGWQGETCSLACAAGTYGVDCLHTCGLCYGNDSCDAIYGLCLRGCDSGYTGPYCSQVKTESGKDRTSVIAPVLGGAAALIICCLVVIIIILVVRMRKSGGTRNENQTENAYDKPNMNVAPNDSDVYDTIASTGDYEMNSLDHDYQNS